MRELSVAEQRYQAVLAVIEDGLSVTEVAAKVGVSRQTLHAWLGRMPGRGWRGWQIGRIGRCAHVESPAIARGHWLPGLAADPCRLRAGSWEHPQLGRSRRSGGRDECRAAAVSPSARGRCLTSPTPTETRLPPAMLLAHRRRPVLNRPRAWFGCVARGSGRPSYRPGLPTAGAAST